MSAVPACVAVNFSPARFQAAIYALVYEYERIPGQVKLNVPGALSSLQHLQSAGI